MKRIAALLACLAFGGHLAPPHAKAESIQAARSMWVWTTENILVLPGELDRFVEGMRQASTTDVYLWFDPQHYVAYDRQIVRLLTRLNENGIRAWGLEGSRRYFSDVDGPARLYRSLDEMIAFNERNPVKFVGFHSDLEPEDGQGVGRTRFHDGISGRRLTPEQRDDRVGILTEWLAMHKQLSEKVRAAGLLYGGAMPPWIDVYQGEVIQLGFEGRDRVLLQHVMPLIDDYVVMSYSTNPEVIFALVVGELRYADEHRIATRVLFAVETHRNIPQPFSYADVPGKNDKSAVLDDIDRVFGWGRAFKSFGGSAIHAWTGWKALPPGTVERVGVAKQNPCRDRPSGWRSAKASAAESDGGSPKRPSTER